ncbi:M23 family metallopeptidase, partial [bacterium]|nr:M23 family metallopeptidase [bacterium]
MYNLFKIRNLGRSSVCVHALIFVFFATGLLFNQNISKFLQANSIAMLKHSPVSEFIYPFSQSINWSSMLANSSAHFSQIDDQFKINPIKYDSHLLGPVDNLAALDNQTINARLTYSVAYMGNYKLDGKQYAGSHPGVDIKLPVGTPIVAIANAVVTKTKQSEVGFGNHIVLRHNNVPDLESGDTQTLFSSYAHLSSIVVSPGEIVTVGQIIGYSGNSGLSSGAHLNFQIEKSSAPWHPFWPFSDTEVARLGLSFSEAINQGYGYDSALVHTLNPLVYIDSAFHTFNTQLASLDTRDKVQATDKELSSLNEHLASEVLSPAIKDSDSELVKPGIIENIKEFVATVAVDFQANPSSNVVMDAQVDPTATPLVISDTSEISYVEASNFSLSGPNRLIVDNEYEFLINAEQSAILASKADFYQIYSTKLAEFPKSLAAKSENTIIAFTPRVAGNYTLSVVVDNQVVLDFDFVVAAFDSDLQNDEDYEVFKFLKNLGFIEANTAQTLAADRLITRAESLKFLVEYLEFMQVSKKSISQHEFLDVSDIDWFNDYVKAALEYNLIDFESMLYPESGTTIDWLLALYYKSSGSFVSPVVQNKYANSLRVFGANKLFVQQALIDGLIE